MKKHPISVPGYEDQLEILAERVNAMRYDLVIEFYQHSYRELRRQAAGDKAKGRVQTAAALEDAVTELEEFIKKMDRVWHICKPYMKDEMGL